VIAAGRRRAGLLAGVGLLVAVVTAAAAPPPSASTPPDAGAPADAGSAASGAAAPTPTRAPEASPASRAAARALHAQGLARLKQGDADEAERLFTRAVEKDPDDAVLVTDLGFTQGKLGRRAEAEATLRAAITKDPRRFYAYINLADLLADDPARWERRDRVVAYFERGLEALKDDPRGRFLVLVRIANFERAVGRTAAARGRLEPLLSTAHQPPLTRAQRKRVLDLLDAIALDERAQAIEDWPTPPPAADDVAEADAALRLLDAGRAEEARVRLDAVVRRAPSWPRARLLRGRALEALGRVDEAARDLEIAVNLAPSQAGAWRALGRLLALDGGALEADRADEALRNALALEPSWGDLRQLRAQLARRRAALAPQPAAARGAGPSDRARSLYQEAEEWIEVGDPAGLGRDLVEQALAESPGYVAAAVTAYAIGGAVPSATVAALWDDGPALWELASGVRQLRLGVGLGKEGEADTLTAPWIDRAVDLDVQEARFARALTRAAAGQRDGALADLIAYVAREPRPAHLAEARALRAGLLKGDARSSPELLARIRLLEDRPDAALGALGGSCAPGVPGERLRAMGVVHEYGDGRAAARRCYELAADAGDGAALGRLGRLDARLPDAELRDAARAPLARAAASGVAAASWALARLAADAGDEAGELAGAERALALAAPASGAGDAAEPWIGDARAARDGLLAARRAEERARRERRRRATALGAAVAVVAAALVLRRRFGGRTVAAALRRRPALYPEVARAVAEIRHDVLKHRAGLLGLVSDPGADRADVRRALVEPQPTSAVVAAIYDRVAQAARGQGIALRPLAREPVFGALTRDLAQAELWLGRPAGDDVLLAIDRRLRGPHVDRLIQLVQLGPRTRVDAAELTGWIGAVEAATRRAGGGWAAPALMLGDLAVDFPVERGVLSAIFANLLRNAQAAVDGRDDARVIVRVDRDRDVTGRLVANLFVGDSAAAPLTLEAIEARESGRGLAIVRDLVRQWRGHMVVRPEPAPFTKQVGACFPL
jgi:tetratricopeptide (TPR) repeat protein